MAATLGYLPDFTGDSNQPILTGLAPLVPGALVAGRYRLGEMVVSIGWATRWSGFDQTLGRPVFITALSNDETTMPVLEAARMASAAMDARFWRILDAERDAEGAYIITERSEAVTLAEVLRQGPLSGEESAWVVREIAAALASVHAVQLFHCRLDPAKIYIAADGGIKIAGLGVDMVLTPRPDDDQLSRGDMEAMDVVACGGLLYACLTATWPGGAKVGLPPSPRTGEGLAFPAQARPGTPVALDLITRQILSLSDPNHLASAREIDEALTGILGQKDVRSALVARATNRPAVVAVPDLVATEEAEPATSKAAQPLIVPERSAETAPPGEEVAHLTVASEMLGPEVSPKKAQLWARAFLVLLFLVVVSLVTALVIGLYNQSRPAPPPPRVPVVRTITDAQAFDPKADGGSGQEMEDLVKLAYDGNPTTAWTTEDYDHPVIPEKKPGVGLVFDLGEAVDVSQVTITVNMVPTAVVIYVPGDDPASVTKPDMSTVKTWMVMGSSDVTDSVTTIEFEPVLTRYVLVYLTKVVPILPDGHTQADIAEVKISG